MFRNRSKIPAEGLEPTLPKEHDFESCASANSATPAFFDFKWPAKHAPHKILFRSTAVQNNERDQCGQFTGADDPRNRKISGHTIGVAKPPPRVHKQTGAT